MSSNVPNHPDRRPSLNVLSHEAEAAIRMLRVTHAQYRRAEVSFGKERPVRGRLTTLPTNVASRQIRAQSTLLRMVSITESFASEQLVEHLEDLLPSERTDFLQDLYLREEDQAIGTWRNMQDRYRKWFKINISGYENWDSLNAAINARNSIAHGLGELTRRQKRDKQRQNLERDLARIGITLSDGRLRLSDRALAESLVVFVEFVIWLDEELRKKNR